MNEKPKIIPKPMKPIRPKDKTFQLPPPRRIVHLPDCQCKVCKKNNKPKLKKAKYIG